MSSPSGHCPHGGDGCGVCSTLDVPWIVSRELDRSSAKDSCRLLASGARRVYWQRVLRSELAEGAADLVTRVPSGWVGVGESSSLVSVVEPGLFLLVRAAGSSRAKPSAWAVAHLADRVVVSDGRSFDLDLDRISVVDGQWALRREACAVVVVGADDRSGAALRRTLASLEAQFDRVVIRPETADRDVLPEPSAALPDLPDTWCLATPPVVEGVPPGLVNALFRRRAGVDAVAATTRPDGRGLSVVLCRRELPWEAVACFGDGFGAAALGDRYAVRELRSEEIGSSPGLGRLPVTVRPVSAASPDCRRGAGAP